jgi:hypothetical protein
MLEYERVWRDVGVMTEFPGKGSKLTQEQWEEVQKWHREGHTLAAMSRMIQEHFGVSMSRERLRAVFGPKSEDVKPFPGSRSYEVVMSPEEADRFREVAASLGYRVWNGNRVGEGSMSALIRGIARGNVRVKPGRRKVAA